MPNMLKRPTSKNAFLLFIAVAVCAVLFSSASFRRDLRTAPHLDIRANASSGTQTAQSAPERHRLEMPPGGTVGNSAAVDKADAAGLDLDNQDEASEGGDEKERSSVAADTALAGEDGGVDAEAQSDPVAPDADREDVGKDVDDEDEVEEEREAAEKEKTKNASSSKEASESAKPTCFLYDRPPRTGSTTMSRALAECMGKKGRGYIQPPIGPRSMRPYYVRNMLKLKEPLIGVMGRHMAINTTDMVNLRSKCGRLFYVTSTQSMRKRLWSFTKHRLTRGNNTMTDEVHRTAVAAVTRKPLRAERYLEDYPYLNLQDGGLDINDEDKLVPDYVVRSEMMNEDLGKLLEALQCKPNFVSQNTRKNIEDTSFLKKVQLQLGDATYVRLMKLASEGNEEGLNKARTFR